MGRSWCEFYNNKFNNNKVFKKIMISKCIQQIMKENQLLLKDLLKL